ncbi:MAG TPA: AMP-binding protein, partial [Methylomirabilota bacterium]|nr:AMP-binding protein [Methylomirabilota bacterium]
ARQFWDDIARYDCTLFQYIGELCRFLLAAPPHPRERAHRIRLVSGNGLRPDIWANFQKRFAIPRVLEWYAATEGNAVLFNLDGRPGAVGRIPGWARRRFPMRLVRTNEARDDVIRGPDGRCIVCADGEPGELISEITDDPRRPSQRFEGYTSDDAGRSKVLTDVFRKGDRWFRTGDLLCRDRLGYFTFVDRLGDTFRWKGENVSTAEVSEALCAFPGILTAAVYGVAISGRDGKAGMATVETAPGTDIDLAGLADHLATRLPAYARPLFLRVVGAIETTGTFKLRKTELAAAGFDPGTVKDRLFLLHPGEGRYVRLDADLHAEVVAGTIRV